MPGRRTRASGELEAAILGVLWSSSDPLTAKVIGQRIDGDRPAHTTLLTALERLQRKGEVRRTGTALRGVSFVATRSEAEHASQQMMDVLEDSADPGAALLRFAGELDARDAELLERAISARRRKRV